MAFTTRLNKTEETKLNEIQDILNCSTNSKTIKKMIDSYIFLKKDLEWTKDVIVEQQRELDTFRNLTRDLSIQEMKVETLKNEMLNLAKKPGK